MVYNPDLDRLELYYIEEHGWSPGTAYLDRKTSTDGILWTTPETLFGLPGNGIQVPGIKYVNGVAHMWYIENLPPFPGITYVWYRNSTDNGITWSAAQSVTLSTTTWGAHHLDIEYIPEVNEFWMALLAFEKSNTINKKVFFANSTNKLYWNVNTGFELTKPDQPWKSSGIYRSSLLYDISRSTIQVWDSGQTSNVWSIGYTEKTYSIVTSPPSTGIPDITGYAPVSPVNDISGALRSFNITLNQTANVNWYINGTPVLSNSGVTNSMYTNTSASAGTWKVNATATNANGMVSREWTWNVTSPASTGKPNITGFAPVSPVNDISGALRSFNITLNQTANVNWYINGTPVHFQCRCY